MQPYIEGIEIPVSMLKTARDDLRYRPVDDVRTAGMLGNWDDLMWRSIPAIVVYDDTVVYPQEDDQRYHSLISRNATQMQFAIWSPSPSHFVKFEVVEGASAVLAAQERVQHVSGVMKKICHVYRLSDILTDLPEFIELMRHRNADLLGWMAAKWYQRLMLMGGRNDTDGFIG